MRTRFALWISALFALLALGPTGAAPARAAEGDPGPAAARSASCAPPVHSIDVRPGAEGPPIRIALGVTLVDLIEINDVEQSATVDLLVTVGWRDPRLAGIAGCRVARKDVWNPQLQVVNSGTLGPRGDFSIAIGAGGDVRSMVRFLGTVVSPHDMEAFPFDEHLIRLVVTSVRYTVEEVEIVVDEGWTVRRETLAIPDWSIGEVGARVYAHPFPQLGTTHSRYVFEVLAERESQYYVFKVLFPLLMIVIMSWSVFWIDPSQFGTQMSVAVTSMLTLIAFQFALGNLLPRVSYFTIMDRFILSSSLLVFVALLEAVVTGYLTNTGRDDLALRIDGICRWAFPAVFGIVLVSVFSGA